MFRLKTLAVGISVCAAMSFSSAAQADPIAANAESVRKLNIMLMVTSLRCRTGEHDFQPEYRRFAAAHRASLDDAHQHMQRQLSASYTARQRNRAMDRIGVSVANTYGNGHPWLDCAGLKNATIELTMSQDRNRLVDMAGILLSRSEPELLASASESGSAAEDQGSGTDRDRDQSGKVAWWLNG